MASIGKSPFQENQEQHAISSESNNVGKKRTSKSRSKVWEKVVWFTGKARGDKDNKAGSETLTSTSDVRKNNIGANVYCLCVENNGYHKTSQKVRKVRSFNYLKRRKVRQFGDQLSSVAVAEGSNTQDCGTATGTFHDFESDRRISWDRHEKSTTSACASTSKSISSDQVPRMNNLPRFEPRESLLTLSGNDFSLREGCVSVRKSPSFSQVRRSGSFIGPAYNSWPRRKPRVKKNDGDCPRHFISTSPVFSEEFLTSEKANIVSCRPKLKENPSNKANVLRDSVGQTNLHRNSNNEDSLDNLEKCASICISASADFSKDNLPQEKIMVVSCVPEMQMVGVKSESIESDGNNDCKNDIDCPIIESKAGFRDNLVNRSDEPMDIPECYPKLHHLQAAECPGNLGSEVTLEEGVLQVKTPHAASDDILIQSDLPEPLICNSHTSHDNKNVDITIVSSSACGESQTLAERSKNPWPKKVTISGKQFKKNTQLILQWFREYNDEQKNILIRQLLEECDLPQMHLLSITMAPILHKNCPPNCQDFLAWLPHHVALHIFSFLDLVSLCHCSQVNQTWNNLANTPLLWQNLCGQPDWQLSRIFEEKERRKYTREDGIIQWKKIFASRYLLHQNWLKGKCDVRTFEGHTQGISCAQFDDTRIASGSYDKTIRVWDIKSDGSDVVLTLAGHSGTVRCLNLNGNRLVSGSVDRSIKVWDLSFESYWSGASCKVTMIGHMHTVRCLQVDDEKVVSGSYDKTLKVWDIKTGICRLTLRGHNAAVLCVQFDDQKIVSGSYDKTIKVWSLAEGSCLMTLTGHHDAVTCLNLAFDSRKVISGSLDHNLKFWDLRNGKCIGTLDWIRSEGHTGVIRCLQTDSWRIVSAGDDKTLKMWSLESGQRLLTLRCHTDGVTCLQFNDYSIVSGSYDRTVKLWDFTPSHEFLTPG